MAEENKEPRYLRSYTCNLWKQLTIGKDIHFQNGLFETDDPTLQDLIEGNNAFGVAIHYQDTLEVMEARGRELSEQRAAEKSKRRREILDELASEEREERRRLERVAKDQDERDARLEKERELRAADEVAKRELADQAKKAEAKTDRKTEEVVSDAPATPDTAPSAFGGIVTGEKKKK